MTITLNNLKKMTNKLVAENADSKVVAASEIVAEDDEQKKDGKEENNAVKGLKELKSEITKTDAGSISISNIEAGNDEKKKGKDGDSDDSIEISDVSLPDDDTIEIYDGKTEKTKKGDDDNEEDDVEISDVSLSDDETIEIYDNGDDSEEDEADKGEHVEVDDGEDDGEEDDGEDGDEIEVDDEDDSDIPVDTPIEIDESKESDTVSVKVMNIEWDTDDEDPNEIGLPETCWVNVDAEDFEESPDKAIRYALADEYGFCVFGFSYDAATSECGGCGCGNGGCKCGGEDMIVVEDDSDSVRVVPGGGENPHLLIKVSNIVWDADEDEINNEGLPSDTTVEVEVYSDYDAGDVREDVSGELYELFNGYEAEDFDVDMAKISDVLESLNFDEVNEGRHVSGRKERRERKLRDKNRKSRQYREATSGSLSSGGKEGGLGILGDALSAIGNGIWGLIKILGRGLIVVVAALGGSFLFGLPGLLLAVLVAFGLVGGQGVMESKDIDQKKKSLVKRAIGLLKNLSKDELKALNKQVKSGSAGLQAVAAKIRKMVNAGDEVGQVQTAQQNTAQDTGDKQENQVSEDGTDLKDQIDPKEVEKLDDEQKAAYLDMIAAKNKLDESVNVTTPKQILDFARTCETFKTNKTLRESAKKFEKMSRVSPKLAKKVADRLESEFGSKKIVEEKTFCKRFCELVNESGDGDWFRVIGTGTAELNKDLPEDCISDLSGSGDKTDSAEMWVEELGFDKNLPIDIVKRYIKSTGSGDDPEKMTEKEMAMFVLWSLCNNISEERHDIESRKDEYIEENGEEEYERVMNHSVGFAIEGY